MPFHRESIYRSLLPLTYDVCIWRTALFGTEEAFAALAAAAADMLLAVDPVEFEREKGTEQIIVIAQAIMSRERARLELNQ